MVSIGKAPGIDISNVAAQQVDQLQTAGQVAPAQQQVTIDPETLAGLRSALDISVKNTVTFILMNSAGPLADRLQQANPKEREALIESIATTLQTQSVDAVMDLIRNVRA